MRKITTFLIAFLLMSTGIMSQPEPYVVSHLFLRATHCYTIINGVEQRHDYITYIWMDDYEVKIYQKDIPDEELKFEGDIDVRFEDDYQYWMQTVRNTETGNEYNFILITDDRPNKRFVILDSPNGNRLTYDCEVISAHSY